MDLTEATLREMLAMLPPVHEIRESAVITDDSAILAGPVMYVRCRRGAETFNDVLNLVRRGIVLPKREPWPTGPLVLPHAEATPPAPSGRPEEGSLG